MPEFKSNRGLREELTGIRLAAAGTSIWNIAVAIDRRAGVALNDALKTYPFPVNRVYNSVSMASEGGVIALPPNVLRVTKVEGVSSSLQATVLISDYKLTPAPYTSLLEVNVQDAATSSFFLNIEYEEIVQQMPDDKSIAAPPTAALGTILVNNPNDLPITWPARGWAEITATDTSAAGMVELIEYTTTLAASGVVPVTRGAAGTVARDWSVYSSVILSPVVVVPPEAMAVVMKAAEANMYEFWAGHRATYDQYVAITGFAQLDVADILAITRVLEDRAERRYKRLKDPPAVTRVQVKRRGDVNL